MFCKMNFKILKIISILINLTVIWAAENRDDWIDPNDMLNFDPSTNTMKKNKVEFGDLKPVSAPTPAEEQEAVDVLPQNDQPVKADVSSCPPCETGPSNSCLPCERSEKQCPEPVFCPECTCEPQKECLCEQAAFPLLRQYVRTILGHLGDQAPVGEEEDYAIHITLSRDRVSMLEKFAEVGNQKHIHDVHDILTSMIGRIGSSRMGKAEKMVLLFEEKIGLKLDRLIQFIMLGALASVILLIETRLQIAWRRRITQLIVLMFCISVPWTWYDLYKQAEIKQHSIASRPIPKECLSGEKDTLAALWTDIKSYFTLQNDRCHDYHEHLLIDPLVKVPPTNAIAVTFIRFFLAPLKDVGSAVSEFLRALLKDLPLTLYPVALAMVSLFFFMMLFMWFGYSIRLPLFLTIERSPQLSVADSHLHQAIQDTSERTLTQMKSLQEKLESTEAHLTEKLGHMQQVQQAAIEYTVSSQPASPAGSPSLQRSEVNIVSGSPDRQRVRVTDMSPPRDKGKVKSVTPVKSSASASNKSRIPVTDVHAQSLSEDNVDGDISDEEIECEKPVRGDDKREMKHQTSKNKSPSKHRGVNNLH